MYTNMKEIKKEHKDLYWKVISLLQEMKNGGTALVWILNMSDGNSITMKNFEKAMKHINIAIEILHGTMYEREENHCGLGE